MLQELYRKTIGKLSNFKNFIIDSDNYKLGNLYFSWITKKTDKIINEKNKNYIYNNLLELTFPNYNISNYTYNKSNNELKSVIDNNYIFDGKKYKFNNKAIEQSDVLLIAKQIIFRRGNVVWIDFGFNIGNEFGGMHPAIILKNLESELFVLPLSSKNPIKCNKSKENDLSEIVIIDKIIGFKEMVRYGNITRMRKVSVLRVNFSGTIGSISDNYLNIISEKIKNEF